MRPIRSRIGWKIVSIVEQDNPRDSTLPTARQAGPAERPPYFKVVCRSVWKQQWDHGPPRSAGPIPNIKKDDGSQLTDQYDRSFDSVKIKYLNFDNVKSIIFTILKPSTSQKGYT